MFVVETGLCEEYQVPYFDMLPGDPSFDEVKKVVVTEQKRPLVPNRWYRDEVCSKYSMCYLLSALVIVLVSAVWIYSDMLPVYDLLLWLNWPD